MSRIISSRIKTLLKVPAFITARLCTTAPIGNRTLDINEVKIVGTILKDPKEINSGIKNLLVETKDSNLKSLIHNVQLRGTTDLTAGQKIYVSGKLNSFMKTDGDSYTCTVIKAQQFRILDYAPVDRNHVELCGIIASDVATKDNHCTFAVVTHFTMTNKDGSNSRFPNFHRVFAYDDGLCEYISKNLTKSDRILFTGKIAHGIRTLQTGKKDYTGFVIPNNICKISVRKPANNVLEEEN